ncbi:MAG: rhomboid family intramembrane serine protease [FCB group bacterium]|nr:rhomboid family intramembrane serine protease [FCB group bacterium]
MTFRKPKFTFSPGVKLLLLVNFGIFILVELSGIRGTIFRTLGLVPVKVIQHGYLWQPLTYLFLHAGWLHIGVNMFVLWMFGNELEKVWGQREFLKYYFIAGIGAGLFTAILTRSSHIPVVGASGAIYGLLLAYGLLYPNRQVYLYFLVPVKMKYVVAGLAAVAFFASLTPGQSPVSHLTHLSGMGIGFLYLRRKPLLRFITGTTPEATQSKNKPGTKPHSAGNVLNDSLLARRVNDVLDKMQQVGWEGLTQSEKNILYDASRKYSRDQPPN